jgi:hypothetical protein
MFVSVFVSHLPLTCLLGAKVTPGHPLTYDFFQMLICPFAPSQHESQSVLAESPFTPQMLSFNLCCMSAITVISQAAHQGPFDYIFRVHFRDVALFPTCHLLPHSAQCQVVVSRLCHVTHQAN